MDISNVRRLLPEGFSRCNPTAYSPSIIIELAELLYIQPAHFINTMRKGSSSYSIVMAFDDAFRTWEGKLMPDLSEWRPINTSAMFLR